MPRKRQSTSLNGDARQFSWRLWPCAVVDIARRVRAAEIATRISIGKLQVIQPHEGQNGRMEIVDMHAIFGGMVAQFVGGAVDEAGLDSTTGHEQRVAVRIVIAAITAFRNRSAAELAGPDHQRVFQQTASLEVCQQPGNGQVDFSGVLVVFFKEIGMLLRS